MGVVCVEDVRRTREAGTEGEKEGRKEATRPPLHPTPLLGGKQDQIEREFFLPLFPVKSSPKTPEYVL